MLPTSNLSDKYNLFILINKYHTVGVIFMELEVDPIEIIYESESYFPIITIISAVRIKRQGQMAYNISTWLK